MPRNALTLLLALAVAALAGGCGLGEDPAEQAAREAEHNDPLPTQRERDQRDGLPAEERREHVEPASGGSGGRGVSGDPARIAADFAARWTTFNPRSYLATQRALGRLAGGELRRELVAGVRALEHDPDSVSGFGRSRGKVIAVDVVGGATRRRAIVVVRRSEGNEREATHSVFRGALAARSGGRWAMVAWEALP